MLEIFIIICHIDKGCGTVLERDTQKVAQFDQEGCEKLGEELMTEDVIDSYACVDVHALLYVLPGAPVAAPKVTDPKITS